MIPGYLICMLHQLNKLCSSSQTFWVNDPNLILTALSPLSFLFIIHFYLFLIFNFYLLLAPTYQSCGKWCVIGNRCSPWLWHSHSKTQTFLFSSHSYVVFALPFGSLCCCDIIFLVLILAEWNRLTLPKNLHVFGFTYAAIDCNKVSSFFCLNIRPEHNAIPTKLRNGSRNDRRNGWWAVFCLYKADFSKSSQILSLLLANSNYIFMLAFRRSGLFVSNLPRRLDLWRADHISTFRHGLQPWTYLDITQRGCMWECKCPNQFTCSLVQSLCNVRLSQCANTADHGSSKEFTVS